jgi:DNA-binding SARP family transcriptional activator
MKIITGRSWKSRLAALVTAVTANQLGAAPDKVSQGATGSGSSATITAPGRRAPAPVADEDYAGIGTATLRDRQRIQIRLLPECGIAVDGTDITDRLQPCAREVLALIAVHKDGCGRERICDLLFGERAPDKQTEMLDTRLRKIRELLRDAIGAASAKVLLFSAGNYRFDPQLVDVDVWRFTHLLARAAAIGDEGSRATFRRRALSIYRGQLLAGSTQLWVHAERACLHNKAVTAVTGLADHEARTDPERAVATLEHATDVFAPCEEGLYRQIMRLHAAQDRTDAVRRTYELLKTRLASELDAHPGQDTTALLRDLA